MFHAPWTRRALAAQASAEKQREQLENLRANRPTVDSVTRRLQTHAELNGWTRIAKELFAS